MEMHYLRVSVAFCVVGTMLIVAGLMCWSRDK
jgi:hypothetical protein